MKTLNLALGQLHDWKWTLNKMFLDLSQTFAISTNQDQCLYNFTASKFQPEDVCYIHIETLKYMLKNF